MSPTRSRRRGLTAVVSIAALVGLATPSYGADSAAGYEVPPGVVITPEIQRYLDTLSPAEQRVVVEERLLASTEVIAHQPRPADARARASLNQARAAGVDVSPLAMGCWTGRMDRVGRGGLGQTLYTSYHVGRWCSNGSTVTEASYKESGGSSYGIGWRHEGRVAKGAGVTANQGRSYSQHKFAFGTAGWDLQTVTPCLRVAGLSTGNYTSSETCGVY